MKHYLKECCGVIAVGNSLGTYLRIQLVWEEEMQGSSGQKNLHSDAIHFFEGDTRNRLCASKGKDTSCSTFNGHAVFASNERGSMIMSRSCILRLLIEHLRMKKSTEMRLWPALRIPWTMIAWS